jgi:hypothetical protein
VIEAEGIRFLADKARLSLVSGLRLEVEQSWDRKVLVASHSVWAPNGSC